MQLQGKLTTARFDCMRVSHTLSQNFAFQLFYGYQSNFNTVDKKVTFN